MNEKKIYQIKMNEDEILRYLGCRGGAAGISDNRPEGAAEGVIPQLHRCMKQMADAAEPKYVYRVFPLLRKNGALFLEGTAVEICGADGKRLLETCHSCIIFAATIGHPAERLLKRAQVTGMSDAVVLDSCGSSAVESLCEQLNADFLAEYAERGLFLTERFSPGYGDMPLEMQAELCELLQTERRIGLSVSPGMTLIPSKSVTAIIGISDVPQENRAEPCTECKIKEVCNIRKAGGSCGKKKE